MMERDEGVGGVHGGFLGRCLGTAIKGEGEGGRGVIWIWAEDEGG